MTYFGIFCWNKLSRMTPFGNFRGVKLSQFGLKFAKVSSFKVCDTNKVTRFIASAHLEVFLPLFSGEMVVSH